MEPLPVILTSLVGERITSIARVHYEHRGEIDLSNGAVELTAGGRTVLIDGTSDGDSLRVDEGPWQDPFAGPLSQENQVYVHDHGKWIRVDCAADPQYANLIGHTISEIRAVTSALGAVAGIRLSVPARDMWITVGADETHVAWSPPDGYFVLR